MQVLPPEMVRPHLKGKKRNSPKSTITFFQPPPPIKDPASLRHLAHSIRYSKGSQKCINNIWIKSVSKMKPNAIHSKKFAKVPWLSPYGAVWDSQMLSAVRCSQVQVLLMSTSRWKRLEVTNWTSSKTSESEPYWTPLLSNTETKTSPKNLWHFKLESPISKDKNPNFKLSFHPSHHFQPFPNPFCPSGPTLPKTLRVVVINEGFTEPGLCTWLRRMKSQSSWQDQRLGVRWGRER